MRRFAIALTALLLLGIFSVYNQYHYREVTEALRHQLAEAVSLARAEEPEAAIAAMERLRSETDRHLSYFNITTNHSEIDLMFEAIDRALAALREGKLATYYIEAELLNAQIHHIYETECITFENVF